MKFLAKLNTTTKVLILLVYTLLVILLAFVLIRFFKPVNNRFSDYGTTPNDGNLALVLRVQEARTTPEATAPETTKESAEWSIRLMIGKINQTAVYRNIQSFITIETLDGKFIYDEASLKTSFPTSSNLLEDSYSKKPTKKNTYQEEEYTKTNQEPKTIYVHLHYEMKLDDNSPLLDYDIKYRVDLLKEKDVDFDLLEERNIVQTGSNAGFVEQETDLINVKIRRERPDEGNEIDNYQFELIKNATNFNEAKITSSTSRLAIFAKGKNHSSDSENYFSDYLQFVQYYGDLHHIDIPNRSPYNRAAFDEVYEIYEFYFFAQIIDQNGTTHTQKYQLDAADLLYYN